MVYNCLIIIIPNVLSLLFGRDNMYMVAVVDPTAAVSSFIVVHSIILIRAFHACCKQS